MGRGGDLPFRKAEVHGGLHRQAALVGSHQGRTRCLLLADRLVDPPAHVGSAAAALGILAAGAEDIDWATGAGPYGGIDIAFPDGPADAKIHVFDASALQLRLTRRQKIKRRLQSGQEPWFMPKIP
jgi:hypothetical protein